MKDKSKNLTSSEKLAAKTEGFFSRNYRLLIIIVVVVLLICAGIGIWSVVSSNSKEATANAVYSLEEDYNALFLMDSTTSDYTAACDQFVADAEAIIASTSSDEYANIKTNYLLGLYYFSVKDWNNAAACFDTAALVLQTLQQAVRMQVIRMLLLHTTTGFGMTTELKLLRAPKHFSMLQESMKLREIQSLQLLHIHSLLTSSVPLNMQTLQMQDSLS